MFFSDLALSQRIETANAVSSVKMAELYAQFHPDSGAATLSIAGGYAIYLGDNSPLTQALGMGLNKDISVGEMEELEDFYFCKNSAVNIELSPLVNPALLELLANRHYHLVEVSNVLVKKLHKNNLATHNHLPEIEISSVDNSTIEAWTDTVIKGFGAEGEFASTLNAIWRTGFQVPDNHFFLAKIDNNPTGGGGVFIYEKVASLSGASTLPEFRKLGIQTKLLQHRLNLALELGCDLAIISTLPGTISQRNAERQGFQVAYTRIKLMRPKP